ncbi:hypothetical protein LCGC14_1530620 [marine sediment metagenome]|uniref:Uncharacterized protein n=1 Tax=marine sediment metagenome TaxID=412755 RepID=A0A0F9IVY2_9ZZZZ
MEATTKNIVAYVNKTLDRTKSNNVAICLGRLNKNTLKALACHFKSVQLEPFGYIRFER